MPWLFFLDSSPDHTISVVLPNFCSSEDYDHHVIANHLQIKHDQHNPTINQGSSKCCLSETKGKTHVGFNKASLQDDGVVKCYYISCSFIRVIQRLTTMYIKIHDMNTCRVLYELCSTHFQNDFCIYKNYSSQSFQKYFLKGIFLVHHRPPELNFRS